MSSAVTSTSKFDEPFAPGARSGVVKARDFALRYGMVWVLVGVAIFASILYPGFLKPANVNDMINAVVPVGVIAFGMTFVIIGGGFDLSVAAIYAGGTVFYATLANHMPLVPAFILTIFGGVICGIVNGLVITIFRINSFIATLATASLYGGAAFLYTGGLPISVTKPGFQTLGTGKWWGIWISVYILVGLALLLGVLLSTTSFGRGVFAVGGNGEAARLAGMRVNLVRISTYVIVGACAALGGTITASQLGVGQPGIGVGLTLNAIAIVIIGGTSLLGGEGAIWRSVVGLAIWGMVTNLFNSLALSQGAQMLIVSVIVLIAVGIESLSRRFGS